MHPPAASFAERTAAAVESARLSLVYDALPAAIASSSGLGLIACIVLWPGPRPALLALWYASLVAIGIVRGVLYRRYRAAVRAGTPVDHTRWRRAFFLGTFTAGTIWGSLCIGIFPADVTSQVFIAFMLAGNAAGAVTSLAVEPRAAFGFMIPSVTPLAVQLLLQGTAPAVAMSVMVLLFLAYMRSSVNRIHQQLTDVVTARMEADAHAHALGEAQLALRAIHDRHMMAMRAGKVGLWDWNLIDKTLVWDSRMYEMYDLRPDGVPLTYETWRQRVHPQDLAHTERLMNDALSGVVDFDAEFRIVWSDGTERSIKAAAIIERDAEGMPIRMTGINTDITELRRVSRMKSEFVSIVSHELRTPLTSIRASIGLLASGAGGTLPERTQKMVELANRNAERLSVLIDDILDMDRIESGRMRFELTHQPLAPLIEQALAANAAYADMRGVRLRLDGELCDTPVHVDRNRLLQVMANLLSNAAKFSPIGATVDVTCRRLAQQVRVEVRDHGPGISPEFQRQIFGKFCQGDSSDTRAKGGSGLGLAISKAIIEQMNGSIGFITAPGTGTTFHFDLPVRTDSDPAERTVTSLEVALD